jgi:hypothetical protein
LAIDVYAIARLELGVSTETLGAAAADQDADPSTLPEWELSDSAAICEGIVANDELEHLGQVVVDPAERDSEALRGQWNRDALDEHREEDDDEDDPVDLTGVVDRCEHRE